MKRILLAGLAALALTVPADAQAVGGRYQAQGTNFDGSPYSGEAVITLSSETTCEIKWITGPTEASGICMRNGDSFAAGYVLNGKVGLIIYKLMDDGSMNGLWTIAGANGNGTEVLIPIE